MSILSYIGILGGIFSLCGYIPYAKQVIEGKEHPERATWLIWTLSNALILLSYTVLGARSTIWVPLAYLAGSAFITVLAFQYGRQGWGLVEKVALTVAFLTSIRWVFFDKPLLALILNLAIGMTGYIRITGKLISDRTAQEDVWGWALYFIGAVLNLFAVDLWTPTIALVPVALVVMNGLVLALVLRNRRYAPNTHADAGTL